MIKGKWVILGVLAVSLAMGLATWPLLRVRMGRDIRGTQKLVNRLSEACNAYKAKYGSYPSSLALVSSDKQEPKDAWGRPLEYSRIIACGTKSCTIIIGIYSKGPLADDPSDDISVKP